MQLLTNYFGRITSYLNELFNGNTEAVLFSSIFVFMWTIYLWEEYLEKRQTKILNEMIEPTEEVTRIMSTENYTKARLYSIDTKNFKIVHSLYTMIESSLILCLNVLPWLWNYSLSLVTLQSMPTIWQELNASMIFILIWSIYSFVTGLPWSVYSTFIIEEKHGFNKQTPIFFIKDKIKSLLLSIVLTLPITYALLYIVINGGPHFYIYCWAFAVLVMLFLMFIYPEFIAPLFDKYVLLPEGDLKEEIEKLAKEVEFPLTKLYVVEGSKRSSHSNAYFYGFWKNKRIVLFDTLLKDFRIDETKERDEKDKDKGCTNDEILAVLGHEFGHWKLHHTLQMLFASQINVFILFFTFGYVMNLEVLYHSFGFGATFTPTIVRLFLVLSYFMSPYHFILEFFMTVWTRRNEFQADKFAFDLGRGDRLIDALIKLQNDNLSFPIFDRLYSLFNHSHPPVLERIDAIKQMDSQKKHQ